MILRREQGEEESFERELVGDARGLRTQSREVKEGLKVDLLGLVGGLEVIGFVGKWVAGGGGGGGGGARA